MALKDLPRQSKKDGYEFTAMTSKDLKLLEAWRNEPHVATWWTPSREDMEDLRTDLASASPAVGRYLVSYQGRPFAYIQCYDPATDPYFWSENPQPEGTRGIDQFIGDSEMIGFGHGAKFLKAFVQVLFEDNEVRRIIVDPSPENAPAIRSYQQAGFRREKTIVTPEGPAVLMVLMRG